MLVVALAACGGDTGGTASGGGAGGGQDVAGAGGGAGDGDGAAAGTGVAAGGAAGGDAAGSGDAHPQVQITMADGGVIVVELDRDAAPLTVNNFLQLVNAGFYDGLTYHRIVPGFVIQGGDPSGNGTGGSAQTIKGEFAANGVANNIKHTAGVISMARSQSYDSASSQFFICLGDATNLDGSYAAFGRVVSGMDVVERIAGVATDSSDKPLEDVVMESVREI
jgi:peptidyl-prolyl cis-trans isomerase B (cyclophilin B)